MAHMPPFRLNVANLGQELTGPPPNPKKRRKNSQAPQIQTAPSVQDLLPPPLTGYGDTIVASNPFDDCPSNVNTMTTMGRQQGPPMGMGGPPGMHMAMCRQQHGMSPHMGHGHQGGGGPPIMQHSPGHPMGPGGGPMGPGGGPMGPGGGPMGPGSGHMGPGGGPMGPGGGPMGPGGSPMGPGGGPMGPGGGPMGPGGGPMGPGGGPMGPRGMPPGMGMHHGMAGPPMHSPIGMGGMGNCGPPMGPSQMNGPMSSPMNGPMGSPMGSPMNGPMGSPMNGPMGSPMNGPNGPMGVMNGPPMGGMNGPMGGMNGPMGGMNGPPMMNNNNFMAMNSMYAKPMPVSAGKVYPADQPMVFNSQNPNAPPIYPCGVCHKEVHDNDQAILCESGCNFWFHRGCTGLTESAFLLLTAEVYAEWVCDKCLATKNIPLVKFKP